jgi:glycosyltransferase involved in cell wall biosynthesis
MNILMATHYYSSHGGGIELVAQHLSSELRKLGHQVKWVATDISEGLPEGIECVPMSGLNVIEQFTGMPYPLWGMKGFLRLYDSIKEADIVHVHEGIYVSSQVCARLARFMNKKVVLTQHVGQVPTRKKWLRTLMQIGNASLTRHVMNNSEAVVFVSRVVRDFFKENTHADRTLIIANGVDPWLFHQSSEPLERLRSRLGVDPKSGLVWVAL